MGPPPAHLEVGKFVSPPLHDLLLEVLLVRQHLSQAVLGHLGCLPICPVLGCKLAPLLCKLHLVQLQGTQRMQSASCVGSMVTMLCLYPTGAANHCPGSKVACLHIHPCTTS